MLLVQGSLEKGDDRGKDSATLKTKCAYSQNKQEETKHEQTEGDSQFSLTALHKERINSLE